MADDLGEYVEYSLTINGEKHSITARGWFYTHAVAYYDQDDKWRVDAWYGAKIGERSSAGERAEAAVEKLRHTSKWRSHTVVEVGKDYQL